MDYFDRQLFKEPKSEVVSENKDSSDVIVSKEHFLSNFDSEVTKTSRPINLSIISVSRMRTHVEGKLNIDDPLLLSKGSSYNALQYLAGLDMDKVNANLGPYLEFFDHVLSRKPNLHVRTDEGYSPLHLACLKQVNEHAIDRLRMHLSAE